MLISSIKRLKRYPCAADCGRQVFQAWCQ